MLQQPSSPRQQVAIDAKILSPDLAGCIDCVVKDVSDGGALVGLPEDQDLPDRVYLWQAEAGQTIACEVRWRKPQLAGLRFIDRDAPAVRALNRMALPAAQRVVALPLSRPRKAITVPSPAAAARLMASGL
jgi:hypothetical protein